MEMITRWQAAQVEERKFHTHTREGGIAHYRDSYRQYFDFLGIDSDLRGRRVAEVGPGDIPALAFCSNVGDSVIVEPMPSEILQTFGIPVEQVMAEQFDFSGFDEVWLLNVLQHVVDPNAIVWAAKEARVVRFFEPVNYGVDACHLHNLTIQMFEAWFGDVVQYYEKNKTAQRFHQWECAYGVWRSPF